jgi:hypothetical protein
MNDILKLDYLYETLPINICAMILKIKPLNVYFFFYIKEGLSPKENYNKINLGILIPALASRKIYII